MHKAKKEVWTMMDEWKNTKVARVRSAWDGNKCRMYLACLVGMDEVLEASFD